MLLLGNIVIFIEGLALFGAGAGACYFLLRKREKGLQKQLQEQQDLALSNARREADNILREAKLSANEEALKIREQTEKSFAQKRQEISDLENRHAERERLLNNQLEKLVSQEKELEQTEEKLQKQSTDLEKQRIELHQLMQLQKEKLQNIAGITELEARTQLLKQVEADALKDANNLTRHILDDAKSQAEEKARYVLSVAIQRYAGDHTFETTTATIALPGDEIKGRIIGREGRNIRAFEAATGVTVLIDDTPNAVVLSGFDPVRREIAREAMQRLILDGRIHPTRIEEVVQKVTEEMDETIVKNGEEAVFKVGLPQLHPEIVKLLGRLRFRHSFSQNVLDHSIEVARFMSLMASEMGIDVQDAKRAGLLHDIGKAIDHEVEGSHAIIGADFIKRHGEAENIVNGVASHHGEVPHTNPLGVLVSAADAISASRPGARSETMTTYIKRLEDLERIGCSFPGVDKCYAVQAGRELRVLVQPEKLSDEESYALAKSITRKIEEELQYPGQIRVTVVRETRAIEFAK